MTILKALQEHGPQEAEHLADRTGIALVSVYEELARLEARNLVAIESHRSPEPVRVWRATTIRERMEADKRFAAWVAGAP